MFPKEFIFIGIDAQVDFITGALPNKIAENNVELLNRSAEEVRNRGGKVYWTQDTHGTYEEYMASLEGQKLPVHHCEGGTPGWDFHPAIKLHTQDDLISKPTFGSLDLVRILRERAAYYAGVPFSAIIMGGYDTDVCGVSNALIVRATFPNTPIYWLDYASAGVTAEGHAAAKIVMTSCQIDILHSLDELIEILDKKEDDENAGN